MPRNVRNFWIEAQIDGREATLMGGPVSKDGGFTQTIYMRHEGSVERALTLTGEIDPSTGRIRLWVEAEQGLTIAKKAWHKPGQFIIETSR